MIEILHRQAGLAVVNKPAGISLLADRSGAPCLWDALPDALGERPLLVHRLDKGTSGVLLVALSVPFQQRLTRAFQRREIRKYYLARVSGSLLTVGTERIDLPLRKGRKSRYRVAGPRDEIRRDPGGWRLSRPGTDGHASLTRLRTLEASPESTLLLLSPLTGRTHQLRVHMQYIKHPIVADDMYGGRVVYPWQIEDRDAAPEDPLMNRTALHAWKLELDHPTTGKRMLFTADLPEDIQNLIDNLRKYRKIETEEEAAKNRIRPHDL